MRWIDCGKMAGFYLSLLSEMDVDKFGDNSAHHFRNLIQPEINISGMECALVEIKYDQILKEKNPNEKDEPFLYVFDFLVPKPNNTWGEWHKVSMKDKPFKTPAELANQMNQIIWRRISRLRDVNDTPFWFDENMRRLWYQYRPNSMYLILVKGYLLQLTGIAKKDEEIQYVGLGKSKRSLYYKYGDETRKFADGCHERFKSICETRNFAKSEPLVGLSSKYNDFLVYANFVSSNAIGSTYANYLRFVGLDEKDEGKTVTKTFDSRYYFPVGQSYLSTVEIQLRVLEGGFVPLKEGCTRIIVHFRPIGQYAGY